MIILIVVIVVITIVIIWGIVTKWKFICKKDKYEKLQRGQLTIFYINLLNRKDRKLQIEKEMKKIKNSNAIRIDAPKTKNGTVGCQLAHITALSVFLKSNLPFALIVEDDFIWINPNKANKVIDKLLKNSNKSVQPGMSSWEIVLLSCNGFSENIKSDLPLKKVKFCQTTSSYLIKRDYAKKLRDLWIDSLANIAKFKLFNPNAPYDTFRNAHMDVKWSELQKKDTWYCTKPLLGKQRASYSDIMKGKVNYGV